MDSLKQNKRLIIAVSFLAVLAVIVIYQYGFVRVQAKKSLIKEQQDSKIELLEKYTSLIAEKTLLENELSSLKEERKAESSKLIEGSTPSIAAASLQNEIKGIITDNGGTISSEKIERSGIIDTLRVISVSVNALLPDAGALGDILYAIETHIPYLVVKELDVRVKNYRRPTGEITIKLIVSAITDGN